MNINKENENITANETEEITSAATEDTQVLQQIEAEESQPAENTEEDDNIQSTLSIDADDIDRELANYGLTNDEQTQEEDVQPSDAEPEKKNNSPVQKPIIIAAVAFLLTAVIVLGTMFAYKFFTKPAFIGSWSQVGDYNGSMFLEFESDGSVSLDMGGFGRYGYYTTEKIGGYDVIHTDFYELALIASDIITTYSEDKNTMQMYFLYEGTDLTTMNLDSASLETIAMGSIEFTRGKAPEFSVDPENITHASADEFGITQVVVDENVLGTWQLEIMGAEGKYEIYTFNSDGTGTRTTDYVYYETYGCGLGEKGTFKYTAKDGKILITYDYYGGSTQDMVVEYSLDNGKLIMDGTAFDAVK